MLVVREIVDHKKIGSVAIPIDSVQRVEVIIPPDFDAPSTEILQAMRLQETTGFAREVLAAQCENTWNNITPSIHIQQDR